METSDKQKGAAAPDVRYLAVVGGLLTLIIVLLAWLWLHERTALNAARAELARVQGNAALSMQLQAVLGRAMAGPQTQPAGAIQRDALPAEAVNWNGATRQVLSLSAEAGRRLGLRPGDVVVVAPGPTTSSAPAPPAKP